MTNNQLTSTHLAVKSELDGYKIHASRGQATAMAMVRLFESIDRDLEELQERRKADSEPVAYISKSDFDAGYPHILARRDFNKACTMPVYAAQPAPVVPDGYVMVPKEATLDMLKAGAKQEMKGEAFQYVWQAMLAAAPQEVKGES